MFDLVRFICELIFGSSFYLSREVYDYLSSDLHEVVTHLIQQSFSIASRSKRTRLLGDDFQSTLKHRYLSPLYGYCSSLNANQMPKFQTVRQGARILYIQVDNIINFNDNNFLNVDSKNLAKIHQNDNFSKQIVVSSDRIVLHVEWLAVAGKQKHVIIKSTIFENSILNTEQNLLLSYIQSTNLNENILNILRHDQVALKTILSQVIHWCHNNIRQCLAQSIQLEKRYQINYYLTIIDCLLENSSINIHQYLHILSPIVFTCLLYEYEIDESFNFEDDGMSPTSQTSNIWSIRLLAARACVKILKHSTTLVYDVFYIRMMSRLISALTDSRSKNSLIYAILCLFEQLGFHHCRKFLLPSLVDLEIAKILSSKSIIEVLERIAILFVKK